MAIKRPVVVCRQAWNILFHPRTGYVEGYNCNTCVLKKDGITCVSFSAQSLCRNGGKGYFWWPRSKIL